MRWGELKAYMLGSPDSIELVIWNDGEATWYELNQDRIVPATTDQKAVLQMSAGQKVEEEFDLAKRTGIDGD